MTIGIFFYDIRDTQFYDAAVHRAKWLEAMLDLHICTQDKPVGGLFNERPREKLKFFGQIEIWHDRELSLAYGAALGGWSYIIANSSSKKFNFETWNIIMTWEKIIELLKILTWPVVVVIALFLYRQALSKFLSGLSQRVTKLSAFKVSIELAALPSPPSPWSDPDTHEKSEMLGGDVSSTALMELFNRIGANERWDYLIVDVKHNKFWLVSRIFIFTVFLQAMRGLHCVVFVQSAGENRRRLLGLASPEAVRAALGNAFPWLERALSSALCKHSTHFLGPTLSPSEASNIISTFISEQEMRLLSNPKELIMPANTSQIPAVLQPIKPEEWVRLGDQDIWEHTHWLDLSISQVNEAIISSFYERDSSHYIEDLSVSTEERTRALLTRKAPYVALVNSQLEFKALLDREKLSAQVVETLLRH